MRVVWVHPSWRDLVIDHLAGDAGARSHFLSRCGVHGILLAVSVAGGSEGLRRLPLVVTDTDWDMLADRVYQLAPELDARDQRALLEAVEQAVRELRLQPVEPEAIALAGALLKRLAGAWDRAGAPISLGLLERWFSLAEAIGDASRPAPDLCHTWAELWPLTAPDLSDPRDTERFADWLALVALVERHRPELIESVRPQAALPAIVDFLVDLGGDADRINEFALDHVFRALQLIQIVVADLQTRAIYATQWLRETTISEYTAGATPPARRRERIGTRGLTSRGCSGICDRGGQSITSSVPASDTWSPGRSSQRPMRTPLTNVPLVDSRSWRIQRPSRKRSWAWRRDTSSSESTTSHLR
jgi:hypothetical protein